MTASIARAVRQVETIEKIGGVTIILSYESTLARDKAFNELQMSVRRQASLTDKDNKIDS